MQSSWACNERVGARRKLNGIDRDASGRSRTELTPPSDSGIRVPYQPAPQAEMLPPRLLEISTKSTAVKVRYWLQLLTA